MNYAAYFNVFAIRVISADSGATHPNAAPDCASYSVPVAAPTTYLGCAFDNFGLHRLVMVRNATALSNVLVKNFPAYDQVMVISNTDYYGGSGGAGYATFTARPQSRDIASHEFGHSFAALADEYYAGDVYAAEKANMTAQSSPALVKWKAWIGTGGVGVNKHCCGGNAASWYKPTNNFTCKMEALGAPFCSVCIEAIIEAIHQRVNPIVSYLPAAGSVSSAQRYISFRLTELMKPQPNTLSITWKLGTAVIAKNVDSVIVDQNTLTAGAHKLTVSVTDTTALLRITGHATTHVSTVSWTINKSATGVGVQAASTEFSIAVFPNPAGKILNVAFELEKRSSVSIELFSADGRQVRQLSPRALPAGRQLSSMDVEALAPGIYLLAVKVDDHVYTQQWVRQ